MKDFKFKENDIAYLICASFAKGTKGLYEPVIIKQRIKHKTFGLGYTLNRARDKSEINFCYESCLLNDVELQKELKRGSKLL